MLILHEGGFTSQAHRELLEAIKGSLGAGRRAYLIVPEQQTLTAEREMCEILSADAPRVFEVTNFTRFTNTAFRALGGVGGSYSSNAQRSLIMWRVLSELSPVLNMTKGRTRITPAAVSSALGAVRELDGLGISPAMLAEINGEDISDARLRGKLADISAIYALYKSLMSERYNDVSEDTVKLVELLRAHPEFLDNTDVYVDGFISFTEPQYTLLGELMTRCRTTVALSLPRAESDFFEYTEVKATEARLKKIAARVSVEIKLHRPDAPDPAFAPVISGIARLLWRTGGELDGQGLKNLKENRGRVRIFEAETPFDECDFVAADIRRRVIEGARYSDFAIVARGADSYVGILDNSLAAAGIPHYISRRRDFNSFAAVKLINTAYGIVARGLRREDVLTYVKCGLSGVSPEAQDRFELYVRRWSIDGKRFEDGESWAMNPRGYEPLCPEDAQQLNEIREARERIITPLLNLKENADSCETVRDHALALMSFLNEIGLEESLYEKAKRLLELGERELAEENARLWEIICDSLDALVEVTGDALSDAEGFITRLGVVFNEASIAQLPTSLDRVTVGSADTLRVRGVKHVYLIGVNAGEFPANVKDSSYFSERDKAHLFSAGLPIEPDMTVKNARELFSFTRAFCLGRESVTLLYAAYSTSMGTQLPSDVVARIGVITEELVRPVEIKSLSPEERIFTPHDAIMLSGELDDTEYERVREALSALGMSDTVRMAEGDTVNYEMKLGGETLGLIYKGDLYLSQSRLDSFLGCPFSYFAKYVLKLTEDGVSELSANVIGSFIHSVLENFFRAAGRLGGIGALTEEEKRRIAEGASESYVTSVLGGGFGQARTEGAIARLCRAAMPVIDGLCDEFANCRFTPAFFELRTGGRSPESPNPVIYTTRDGGKIIISGMVDRVDTLKSGEDVFVRVVDYKSSSKEFKSSDIDEGRNLQMFLYLKSIVDSDMPAFRELLGVGEGGEIIPAGVIYTKTSLKDAVVEHSDDESAEAAARGLSTREGMILDDEVSVAAMNPDFLPIGAEEEGAAHRFTREGWEADICARLEESVTRLAEGIKSGDVSARPNLSGKSSPCNWCPYKPICRKAKVMKY